MKERNLPSESAINLAILHKEILLVIGDELLSNLCKKAIEKTILGVEIRILPVWNSISPVLFEIYRSSYDLVILTNTCIVRPQITEISDRLSFEMPDLPVIVLSGDRKQEFVSSINKKNNREFIGMPFDIKFLTNTLLKYLRSINN